MNNSFFRRNICVAGLVGIAVTISKPCAEAAWWEHPHDKWYFKDDWKGAEVNRYAQILNLASPATNGWIVIWGDQGVHLKVNGRRIMSHVDRGLIYDTNLTAFITGAQEVRLEAGPGKIVAEGEIVDDQGRIYPFASGCDWPGPVAPGTKLAGAAKPYRPGAASGAFNSAHNGLLMSYNAEETGKSTIAKNLARIQKVRDQSIFLLRRFRAAEEILSFDPGTLWRQAERCAASLLAEAEQILNEKAIPAQKAGHYGEAVKLAQQAGMLLGAAELAIEAACAIEQLEREEWHLKACAELAAGAGKKIDLPDEDIELVHDTLQMARREAAWDDWSNVQKRADLARAALGSLRQRFAAAWGAPVGVPDEFPEDRFGWFNVLPLAGNDPADWEFSAVNPEANWIDLRGVWAFRTDPPNHGEELGWPKSVLSLAGWHQLRVPGAWERQGVQEQNDFSPWDCPYQLDDRRCDDKFYNGYAWYRRQVHVPARWAGQKVVLRIGKVSDWLRVFWNGHLLGPGQRGGGSFVIPAELIQCGETNTIAAQVYNHNDFGGITGGPVSLAVDDAQPQTTTTPGPLSFTSESAVKTSSRIDHSTLFSSAMSPAVVLTSDSTTLHLWGWEAKGFRPPTSGLFLTGTKQIQAIDFNAANPPTIDCTTLAEGWLCLHENGTPQTRLGLTNSKSLLLVFEQRPQAIRWGTNGLGYAELTLSFKPGANRMVIFRFDSDDGERVSGGAEPASPGMVETKDGGRASASEQRRRPAKLASTCSEWARRLRSVPVMCSELARIDSTRLTGKFLLKYAYLDIPDFTGQPSERVAPVPTLLSYGLEHHFPGLLVNVTRTASSSAYAPYRFAAKSETLSYATPLIDKSKLLKGVGELFAKRRAQDNARGGNTEAQMFDDWKTWGFDHCRYAFAWGASWDIPLQKFMGGPVSNDAALWARMDELVKEHTDRGIMAMLCYFFNEDSPQRDSKNLVRNSSRYWQMHPEVRTNCYELWRRIAQRYADYPSHLIAYDFFNEPAYMSCADWNQIIKDLTRIVRSVDSKHLIVCEAGDGWSQPQWFGWLQPTGDTNTIYSFHHYGKHWGYDRDEYYPSYSWPPEKENELLLEVILFGIRYNVPMHCGEFGVSMISPGEDHLAWLDDYLARLERFGIGWNWWNWSGSDIYRTGLKAGNEISPNLAVLRKWIARKTDRGASPPGPE